MPAIQGSAIDSGEMIVASAAVKTTASPMSVMGISVGNHITDDECRQIAAAVIVAIEGQAVDPGQVIIAAAAVKKSASAITVMGFSVGNYITDAECSQIATAVVAAIDSYRANKGNVI
jgi:uncharacterized membrane protein